MSTVEKLQEDQKEAQIIEERTRNQSQSTAWHDQRLGRITASVMGDVMKTNHTTPSKSIIKTICEPTNLNHVPAIRWGNEHEEDAFRLYTNVYTNGGAPPSTVISGEVYTTISFHHAEGQVVKSGLQVDTEYPYLGTSPDGIVKCKCCGTGVLEIKCPFKHRNDNMKEALKDRTFHLNMDFSCKREHKYFAQVQMQMYVAQANFADLVTWTTLDCAIVRVARDQSYIEDMLSTTTGFWKKHVLPELLTRRLESSKVLAPVNKQSDGAATNIQTFCICKTTSEEEDMVTCDQCDGWFHPRCIGLKRLPKSKIWYCKDCKKKQKLKNK